MLNNPLTNKTILVTGASGGIGSLLVVKLSNISAKIICVYNENRPDFDSKDNITQLKADLTISSEWDRVIRFANNTYRKIDIMINCTGLLIPGNFWDHTEEQITAMLKTNLSSVLIGTQKILKVMLSQGFGRIVNLGSVGGMVPMPYSAIYCATKFALRGFTHSLVQEIKDTGVSISLVSPGAVETKMLEKEAEYKKTAVAFISKTLKPDEVVNEIIKVIQNSHTEVIVPKALLIATKLIFSLPSLFSKSYKLIEKIGCWRKKLYLKKLYQLSVTK